jgi:hypothetical protein
VRPIRSASITTGMGVRGDRVLGNCVEREREVSYLLSASPGRS